MLGSEVYDSTSNVTGVQADNSSTVLGSTNHSLLYNSLLALSPTSDKEARSSLHKIFS